MNEPTNVSEGLVTLPRSVIQPFLDAIRFDPEKQRGQRHWATFGKPLGTDDHLRLHEAVAATLSPPLPSPGVERLREALEPFAEMAISLRDDLPDDFQVGIKDPGVFLLNLGHLRRARAALSALPLDGGLK